MNSHKDDSSSITSDVLSIDMLQRMNIIDDSEKLRKDYMTPLQQRTFHEERILDEQNEVFDRSPTTTPQGTSYPYQVTDQTKSSSNVLIHRLSEHRDTKNTTNTEPNMQD